MSHKLLHLYVSQDIVEKALCYMVFFGMCKKDSRGIFFLNSSYIIAHQNKLNASRQLVLFYFFFNNVEDHRRRRTIICKCLASIEGGINDWIKLKRGVEKERNF